MKNTDLISREKLYQKILSLPNIPDKDLECRKFRDDVLQTIRNSPAIASSNIIIRAHWEWRNCTMIDMAPFCSNCNSMAYNCCVDKREQVYELSKFCPECGARMEGVARNG